MCIVPVSIVSTESNGGYVTTPGSNYCCENCGAWLFVHKVPFTLQEHVKTTQTDKTHFFFAKEMLHDKQMFNKNPIQSNNYRRKEMCVDNIKTIGDEYCPTCRKEKCVYISTNKTTSCKKCKACCHALKIPFKDQKPTITLFGGDGTHQFAKKSSRDYKKNLFFEEISPPITTKHIRT